MKNLSERISALSPTQRTLFEARLKQKSIDARKALAQSQAIPRRRQLNNCPLSFDQERLWSLNQGAEGNPAYVIYTASRLEGQLDVEVMHRAIDEIVRRHEILRATFAVVDGSPVMVIAPQLQLLLRVEDLMSLPANERLEEAMRRVNLASGKAFDLSRGPLVRVGLLRLGEQDHVLYLNLHHTITDRWTAAIMEEELAVLYEAFSKGEPSPLADMPIQFPDFAAWQRQWLQGETLEAQSAYWRQQLGGAPMVLELPTDRPRPPVQRFRGAREHILIPNSLLAALKSLAQREGATMFMTMLAAYNLLLYRHSQQSDILVGVTVSNRERPETVGMPGYLLNMVVLRTRLADDLSFRQLLRQVRAAVVGAFAHQDMPLGLLIEQLQPPPDPSRSPLFQVSYIYLDFPELGANNQVGLRATGLTPDNGSSRFDLTLALMEKSAGLDTLFEYNTDLFEVASIRRMLEHLVAMLEVIASDADKLVAELP
jgi:Condensation domain